MNFNPSLIKPLSKQILARSAALAAWIARFLARMFNDVGGCTKKYFLYTIMHTLYTLIAHKSNNSMLICNQICIAALILVNTI